MSVSHPPISTDQVLAFVELARQGSLRRAAAGLHLTEQGLRNRLLALESRLAVELDARGAREEAARMVAMSLGIIAAKPPQWVLALEFLGGEASGTDQPGDEAQQKLLAALLDITTEPR